MFDPFAEPPDMLQWGKVWKQHCGFHIFSINSEGRENNNFPIKQFGLHQCFDAFTSPCKVGMRKPDPGIFLFSNEHSARFAGRIYLF